jgi:N utilization substance protein A
LLFSLIYYKKEESCDMAKRVTKKKGPTPEDDARDFFLALDMIEQEKGIKKEYMLDKIGQALVSAYKKDHEGVGDNLIIQIDERKGDIRMILKREVVEEVDNPDTEIALEDVRRILPYAQLGDIVSKELKTKNFGRIAAQTARQVIIQGIREAERNMVFDEFTSKTEELLTGIVTRTDPRTGALHVKLGSGNETTEALLTAGEQVKGETYVEGQRIKVFVVDVRKGTRGTQVLISRTHYGLVRRLFELEVPEIFDGTVEIRSIAREAGSRTKMAVWSNDPEVDPIGACVGTRGIRVNAIVEELHGEKVDIIKYSDDPAAYIAAALSPADVVSVDAQPEEKTCRVVVPDDQLSLAIGKEGQNARLAAKLTGYKIDIKSVSAAAEEAAAAALEAENVPAEEAEEVAVEEVPVAEVPVSDDALFAEEE